jgi:hypothetical protein
MENIIVIDLVNRFMLLLNVTIVGKCDTDLTETARRHLIECNYYTKLKKCSPAKRLGLGNVRRKQ